MPDLKELYDDLEEELGENVEALLVEMAYKLARAEGIIRGFLGVLEGSDFDAELSQSKREQFRDVLSRFRAEYEEFREGSPDDWKEEVRLIWRDAVSALSKFKQFFSRNLGKAEVVLESVEKGLEGLSKSKLDSVDKFYVNIATKGIVKLREILEKLQLK